MNHIAAMLFCLLAASLQSWEDLLPDTECVLSKGMVITATNPNGSVTISAGSGTERTFSGPGWKKRRNLTPRTDRWYGSHGLYDPGESFSPYGRLLVDEGQLFFETESDSLRYLSVGSDSSKPVFNNRGLVVGYAVNKIPGGESTRFVTIWQIYIKGKRPTSLRGADDSAITVKGGSIPDEAAPHPVSVGLKMSLGDKEYSPKKQNVGR